MNGREKKEWIEISYKIWGYHDGHNEDCLLESDAVQSGTQAPLKGNTPPPSSGQKFTV